MLKSAFKVGELKPKHFDVYETEVRQHKDKSIVMTQNQKINDLDPDFITRDTRKDGNLPA